MSGTGFRAFLERHSDSRRGWMSRLTVLDEGNDPFRCDTPAGHRNAAWFAERLAEFGHTGTIHLRGTHYALIGRPKPGGLPPPLIDSAWSFVKQTERLIAEKAYAD